MLDGVVSKVTGDFKSLFISEIIPFMLDLKDAFTSARSWGNHSMRVRAITGMAESLHVRGSVLYTAHGSPEGHSMLKRHDI